MAALDATPTLRAVADLDVEAPHDGAHHREIFLILRRHPGQLDGAAAVRTRGSHRRSAGLVNLRRTRAARLPAVVRTCAPAGSSAATLGPVLGEGSRLPESCPPRRVELLLEVFTAALPPIPVTLPPIPVTLPPIPVALDPRQLLAQSCDLSLLFLNAGIAGILLRPGTLPWHPTVMPDPLEKYKSKMLDLARHETTPLNKYLSCNHLTSLRRAVALGAIEAPVPYDDPRADVLRQRGLEHEQRLLEQFQAEGCRVEIITEPDAPFRDRDHAAATTRTAEAMRRGADVIYQGRLQDEDGRWSGYPDFLLRVDRPSALGDWSYEALDAKLARTAKGEALLQLLLYSDLLRQAQGAEPEWMHLALGGTDGQDMARFRVVEYAAYYRAVRRRFEAHAAAPPEPYPEPVSHCDICDWKQVCAGRRHADDHLSLVAGITRGQRRRLVERNVTTMTDLAALALPVVPRLDGVSAGALARVREQGRVQVQGRRERRPIHEAITPVEPDKGLAALPEPSDGDLFFDLEGDAFAADGGFEYLFGVVDRNGEYDARWALDQEDEKHGFERFIDRVMTRWAQHPGFHIYHYGAYETTAVKRLMSRYATREDDVDRLLRGRVFVDLHRVVRQGLRASVERYSIKNLEPFYGYTRDVDLTAATRALVRFEAALESGHVDGTAEALRTEIQGYNRDDCVSTLRLAAWLETCRRELEARTGEAVPRPVPRDDERDREQEPTAETATLFQALAAGLPVDDAELDDDQRARWLLAHLLDFHRREDKSMWWEFFDRCRLKEEEHVESRATLGGLTCVGETGRIRRSIVHRYRFPEQAHEIEVGDSPLLTTRRLRLCDTSPRGSTARSCRCRDHPAAARPIPARRQSSICSRTENGWP